MSDELMRAKARAARMKEFAEGDGGLFEVFKAVEASYLDTWMNAEVENTDLREKVWHRVCALRDLRKAMEGAIAKGATADAIIAKMAQANTGRRKMRV